MTTSFASIRNALDDGGPEKAVETLIESLRAQQDYDRLFEALLMRKRLEIDLSVVKPTSLDDVPAEVLPEFEQAYVAAARDVGQLWIDAGKPAKAWPYFRTIREPQPVATALDDVDPASLDHERTNEFVELALHEGANRVAGLRILLSTHGTCNTVTATDQVLHLMTPDERRRVAAMLVRDVYEGLAGNLARDVEFREPGTTVAPGVRTVMAGRDGLFENGNYHIDVSHLHSVVRFGRALTPDDPELPLVMELAEYGAKLDEPLRYPADPPFDDYYRAHLAYFGIVADTDREASLQYFRDRLEQESDARDRQIIAYVLVDLLNRCDRLDEAATIAAEHLSDLEEPGGFSFTGLCRRAGRLDLLRATAEQSGDPVRYAAAAIEKQRFENRGPKVADRG